MQAADDELEGDEVKDDCGDAEEALQVDLDAAADEEDSEDDGDGDAEEGSGEAAERISTVSTPSRRTRRKTKKKRPALDTPLGPAYCEIFSSMEPFMVRAALCMNQIMLITKAAAASMTHPSMMSELNWVRATTMATATLAAMADPSAQKTVRLSSDRPILVR